MYIIKYGTVEIAVFVHNLPTIFRGVRKSVFQIVPAHIGTRLSDVAIYKTCAGVYDDDDDELRARTDGDALCFRRPLIKHAVIHDIYIIQYIYEHMYKVFKVYKYSEEQKRIHTAIIPSRSLPHDPLYTDD